MRRWSLLRVVSYMLSGVGDNCPRWGCIRTGGGGGAAGRRHRNGDDGDDDDDDGDDGDGDDVSLEAYDLAADGGGTACCPGSRCVPASRHRRRRKSTHGCGGRRDKSPGKESPATSARNRRSSWPRSCLRSLLLFSGCHSDCCYHCMFERNHWDLFRQ